MEKYVQEKNLFVFYNRKQIGISHVVLHEIYN